MFEVTIVFKNREEPTVVVVNAFTVHLYGFLELQLPGGLSNSYSLSDIHEFTYPTSALAVKSAVKK